MKLLPSDHPMLRKKCGEVLTLAEWTTLKKYVKPMRKIMRKTVKKVKGVGLAAPQVGIPCRFFISTIEGMKVVINPSIICCRPHLEKKQEGCLSFPGKTRKVLRWTSIDVRFQNRDLNVVYKTLTDFEARVFQHELDHLDGICIFSEDETP